MHFEFSFSREISTLFVVLVVCLIAGTIAAGDVRAAAAPCATPPLGSDSVFFGLGSSKDPNTVLYEIETSVPFLGGANADYGLPGDGATASFQAVPGGHLTYPVSLAIDGNNDSSTAIPVRFARGDSPGVITTSFVAFANIDGSYGYCRMSVTSAPISPVEPTITAFKPYYSRWLGSRKIDANRFRFGSSSCGNESIALTLSSGGKSKTLRSGPGCVWKATRKLRALGWLVAASKPPDATSDDPDGAVAVSSIVKKKFRRKVSYKVEFNGATVRKGSFVIARIFHKRVRGYKIYDSDFDNYVNTCINGNYNTYAENGRLFCFVSGSAAWWETKISKRT